ncbi:MAG: LysR family transcriptional regulator [Neisseriaceae bacterium]|nr:LysR family transcriptional regulator [Neisseriaceae bacterium]
MPSTERLKGISAFVTSADAGSFTAAAEQLHLTNSAVSKQVARLEARLGTRLFERTTRSLSLTDAGAAFYATCVQVLADLDEAEASLHAQTRVPVGKLHLNLPASFGHRKVLPMLLPYFAEQPRLQPQISFTDRFVDLIEEGIDIAVRLGTPSTESSERLGQCLLGSEALIFCAAPAYLAKHGTPNTQADLSHHRAIRYGKADGSTQPWTLPKPAPKMTHTLIIGSGDGLVQAAVAGAGVAQLASWLIEAELTEGRLVPILPHLNTAGLPLHLLWPRKRQLLPKVAAVLALLTAALQTPPEPPSPRP